jgi:hypothetical protein
VNDTWAGFASYRHYRVMERNSTNCERRGAFARSLSGARLALSDVVSLRSFTAPLPVLTAAVLGAAVFAACADSAAPPADPILASAAEPAPATLRRLLSRQYVNSVRSIFGASAARAAHPPKDTSINGYEAIASAQLALNDGLVASYEVSARAIAAAAVRDREHIDALIDCDPAKKGEHACLERFVTRAGRLAFRRPLDAEEIDDFVGVADMAVDQLGGFYDGVEYAIVALIQSPSFLFQIDVGEAMEGSSLRKLNGYEMASRMSFFLLDRGPDEALLDAAERGELDTEEGVRAHARELVRLPEARDASRAFFTEYLELGNIETMAKAPLLFPDYSNELAISMREETLQLVADIIWTRDAPVTEIFTADYTFVDDRLAELYGVDPPFQAGWTRASLPVEQERRGVLSHASTLAWQSHPDGTSVTHRGLFILQRFLCTSMPPPPDDVVTELPPSSAAPTMRERIAIHQANKVCRTCHQISDPIGLALENFDSIGRWRAKENGEVIDASAEHALLGKFDGVRELGDKLATSDQATLCMVRNLFRHATGHVELQQELHSLEELRGRFTLANLRWRELLVELAASPLVRAAGPLVVTEEESP